MHTWWGRKSSRNKGRQYADGNYPNLSQYPIKNDKKREKDNFNSFADVLLLPNSPPKNGDFTGSGSGSSAFSGFDSHRGHPLPRPSFTDSGIDDGSGLGSGSGSVSSVSSSGYSDDPALPPDHTQFGISSARERGETKLNALMPRSPDPGTRGTTTATATSPLHPRYSDMSLESPTRKQEEGKGESHPLPLPPVSPTSPYILPRIRTCRVTDKPDSNMSEWKRGRLLGRGTFGHVYLGFNSETGQMCAIKEVGVIADDQVSKECLKQLNQEIILLSQLSHPNIVQYYGSELGAEKLSVYLEYVSGGSIHKLLQEYGAFKEPVIQNYTRQILSGLAYLHGRKTVHRDIKGANILVDSNGEIKLADFGMAKHINGCSSVLSFKGSPYWMAPEVVMHTNGYSLPVDIWSLGCTIIEMATSKPPWCQFEGVAAIFKIGNSKSRPEIPGHLSPNAKSFLNLCFQRDPLARPTALQLQDHPFVRDQMTSRVGNINLTKENFSYTRNGSRTPKTAFELHSRRRNINFFNGGRVTGDALIIPRESARMITSLPASPCSSPLQHSATGYKRSFLSPPQSSVALVAQNGRNLIEQCPLAFPTRSNAHFSPDPWPHFTTSQTPDGSPILRQF